MINNKNTEYGFLNISKKYGIPVFVLFVHCIRQYYSSMVNA